MSGSIARLVLSFYSSKSGVTVTVEYATVSTYVSDGYLTEGLEEMKQQFESDCVERIDLVINDRYAKRVKELRDRASETKKSFDEPAFRFFQILEHMRGE